MMDADQKTNLKRLLVVVQIKQGDYALDVGLSPAALSEALRSENPRGSETTYRKILGGLDKLVEKTRQNPKLTPEQKAEIESLARRARGERWQEPRAPFLQEPGGWISGDAQNYVERRIDKVLDRYVEGVASPLVIISGPIQSGRSSVVRRLAARATAAKQFADVIDLAELAESETVWTADSIIRAIYLRLEIGMPTHRIEAGELAAEMVTLFQQKFERRLNDVGRGFVIFDSMDLLARSPAEELEVDRLRAWLTGLRGLAGQRPFERLTMVLVANPVVWPTVKDGSLFEGLGRQLATGKLGMEDMSFLFKAYDGELNEGSEALGFSLANFSGHPFLTHLAVSDLYLGRSLEEIRHSADTLEGDFGRHWRRIVQAVVRHVPKGKDPRATEAAALALLNEAAALYRRPEHTRKLPQNDALRLTDLRFLRTIGVLDGSEDNLSMCPFYANAIQRSLSVEVKERAR